METLESPGVKNEGGPSGSGPGEGWGLGSEHMMGAPPEDQLNTLNNQKITPTSVNHFSCRRLDHPKKGENASAWR